MIAHDPYWARNYTEDALYSLVCHAIRVYEADFYVDPATRRIYLTARCEELERLKADRAALARRSGTTAAAHIAEALEEREEAQL